MEHNELEEMRKQMDLLNQKLDKEEIVSEKTICEVTRKKMNRAQRIALIYSISMLFIPLLAADCYTTRGAIFWIFWGLSAFCGNLMLFVGLRNFKKKCNCVAKQIETIQKIQKRTKITNIINLACFYAFLLNFVLIIVFKCIRTIKSNNDPEAFVIIMYGLLLSIIIFAIIGSVVYVFHEIRKYEAPNDILSQILEELQEPNPAETVSEDGISDAETEK